jgi:D-glutamate cyclase-like, C-terminal
MPPALDPIETLCALDLGGRGIGRLVVPGAMAAAARSLARARRVVLVTGFVARPTWAAETDGPSGTVVLGRALRRLGARVAYLADPPVAPLLEACLRALGEPRELIAVPAEPATALQMAEARVRAFGPTHLVAIERPGRAVDGGYYNARGMSVATANAPLDALFLRRRPGLTTIGVGDGGNEIGMGRVRTRVVRDVPNGKKIASVVRTDHLIVGGTSNWGAWGVVAHLALATGRAELHTPKEEARLTRAMVRAGAVDGLTGVAQASVDNLPLSLHQALLETLRGLIGHMKAHRRPVAVAREEETA